MTLQIQVLISLNRKSQKFVAYVMNTKLLCIVLNPISNCILIWNFWHYFIHLVIKFHFAFSFEAFTNVLHYTLMLNLLLQNLFHKFKLVVPVYNYVRVLTYLLDFIFQGYVRRDANTDGQNVWHLVKKSD